MTNTLFKDLSVGDSFDFIGEEYTSFYKRCVKISARRYQDEDGFIHRIGSIKAKVYHVKNNPA